MVSVTSASRYVMSVSRYQSRSSMYIQGLIPQNSTEFAQAVPIESTQCVFKKRAHFIRSNVVIDC